MLIVTRKNYKVVLNMLKEEKAGWEILGTMLGVDSSLLNGIKKLRPNPSCEESFHTLLSQWMKRGDEERTWENLQEALENCQYNRLASTLQAYKGPGMNFGF